MFGTNFRTQKKELRFTRNSLTVMYRGRESNPYERFGSQDFKSCVSTSSTTPACAMNNVMGIKRKSTVSGAFDSERKTGFEPATSTLARSRSTS